MLGIRRCGSLQMILRACCRRLKLTATITLLLISLSTIVGANEAAPPERCDDTGCTLTNAYAAWNDRSTCRAASVVYPATELEILSAVASAVKGKVKIKVVTSTGHSIPILACPGSPTGVMLSTRRYSSIVNIDTEKRTVEAQGGIGLRALLDAVAERGLALPVAPYWDGVTLGGLLATSAHGSSLFGKGGAVHEYVTSMRLVTPAGAGEGYAKVWVLNLGDPDLNSAKVALGVLGVVSTVTLQLEPAFKRNLTLKLVHGDDGLEDETLRIAQNVEFGDVTWYPGLRQVVYRYDDRVPLETPGEGRNIFTGFQPQQAAVVAGARASEELADATRNRQAKCDQALAQVIAVELEGSGYYQNGRFFTGFPVIGHQNLMMAYGGCRRSPLPSFFCPWDRRARGLFLADAGAVLPLSKLRLFLADVKRLRDAAPKSSLCDLDLYTGFLMRFVKRATGAYLGTTQEGDSVMLDFTFSRGDTASEARLDGDVFQEIEQIAFWKYNATLHWGKNRNYVFEGVGGKYKDLGKFLNTKRRFDPDGLFSSAWSDAVLGIGGAAVVVDAPGCALEGLCRCWKDEHCAPEKKSFCRPGRVYSDARVCRIEA